MILQSLGLQGWRCFVRPVGIAGFDERLNVVHAPNGSGKSTLLEALARAFFDRHTTSGEAAEALRPWGRDLAPAVTVCFLCEGQSYRITKRFLDSPRCVLEQLEADDRYAPVASGPQAVERLRSLLMGSAPGHGLCDARHWGMAQVLWAPQGDLSLGELPDTLVGHVQASLSAQLAAAESGEIEQRIEQLYANFFTPTGRVRAGAQAPPVVALEKELETARREHARLQALLEEYARASEDVTRLGAEKQRALAAIEETGKAFALARGRAEVRARLSGKVEAAAAVARAAEAEFARLNQTAEAIATARRDAAEAAREYETLTARLPGAEEAERQLDTDRRTAEGAVEAAELAAAPTELESLVEAARAWVELSRRHGELAELEKRCSEADAERRELGLKCQAHGPVPSRETLTAIREVLRRRESCATRLEAALITLTIEPATGASPSALAGATVAASDRPAPGSRLPLAPGGPPAVVQGSPEVEIDIPGFGRIRARGPAGTADQLRRALADAEQELAELTAPFGTSDPARLEDLAASSHDLTVRYDAAVQTLKSILAPFTGGQDAASRGEKNARPSGETERAPAPEIVDACPTVLTALVTLRETLAEATLQLEALYARHPEWRTTPPDPAALQRRLDDLTAARSRELAELRLRLSNADKAHRQAHDLLQRLRTGLEHVQNRRRDAERHLADLIAADAAEAADAGHRSDSFGAAAAPADREAERRAELNRLAMDRAVALQKLEEAREELRALDEASGGNADDPALLEKRLADLRELHQRAVADEARRQGELARLIADAPYSRLAEVEEQVTELEARVADERQRMDAVRLLRETADHCRRSAFESVLEPVQRSATALFQRLAGERLGPIRLGGSFAVQGVVPEGVADPVNPRYLSGGEREQLHLSVRLALARELARTERRLFVLDDALAATDRGRHARVRELLAEAAGEHNLQVLVLTCHPEFYDEWRVTESAKFFDLQALLAAEELAEK